MWCVFFEAMLLLDWRVRDIVLHSSPASAVPVSHFLLVWELFLFVYFKNVCVCCGGVRALGG